MLEYVVPLPIHKKEQACAKAEAAKLDLLTEMVRVLLAGSIVYRRTCLCC